MASCTNFPLFDLVKCISETSDLISPHVSNHHNRVAYIAYAVADEAGVSDQLEDVALAALVHDVGAPTLSERLQDLQFQVDQPGKHAEAGWLLLKEFEPLKRIAPLVRFHHVNWDVKQSQARNSIPAGSDILHLAESVSGLLDMEKPGPDQVSVICRYIERQSGKMFDPELVKVFLNLARKDYFWFDTVSSSMSSALARNGGSSEIESEPSALISMAKLFSRIVDFRSPYTATHSSGVAACAEALARAAGFSMTDCMLMRVAGYLHDLGKLGVPGEILDKPGSLTEEESLVVKSHAYHTYRILDRVEPLREINTWASFHHERMNGSGYPFKSNAERLPVHARIMAVADTFTALTEDRPHRKAFNKEEAFEAVCQMVGKGELDSDVVRMLTSNLDEVYFFSLAAKAVASFEYSEFRKNLLSPNSN